MPAAQPYWRRIGRLPGRRPCKDRLNRLTMMMYRQVQLADRVAYFQIRLCREGLPCFFIEGDSKIVGRSDAKRILQYYAICSKMAAGYIIYYGVSSYTCGCAALTAKESILT